MYGIKLKVWGDYALFTRPELKVERVSYDFLTPSAARGILDAIYWKPAIRWVIDKIHIINEIQFTNIRRNEVSEVMKESKANKVVKDGGEYSIVATQNRHQRAAMVLKDVCYVIEAHFELTGEKSDDNDEGAKKHYNIALRRMRQGQFHHKPCLGTREFSANFEIIESDNDIPSSSLVGERNFGYMLYDMGYNVKPKRGEANVAPSFFNAKANDGICDLTLLSKEEVFQ
ncbi:MAG: type I-C CRISPR-associated protein Cas5c [Clostridiales Family XIII bacterium]|jgi:CRISPR-associated protein Cas5d|nr:type I-C CRISPR-associated protein Cas5c [Clostridiales Family XIII bacterium]